MGWIQEHLLQTSQKSDSNPTGSEDRFKAAAHERWLKLGEELQADVAEFNSHHSGAGYAADGNNQYRVSNPASGLELVLTADFDNHTVRYDYSAINQQTAGVPEGGMLSMRQSRLGRVEFYSADERLTSEETRQVLLESMLFPRQSAA
jgi:hypothetical protein